jgi:hypothetical protein
MLVTHILGDCPGCKAQKAFGNVFIHGQTLTRGCGYCNYTKEYYLPDLSKEVLYLDQCFYSHSFRAELSEFVDCTTLITDLANDQLLVSPFSSVHETETHQWRNSQQQKLWTFIKRISRGHSFAPNYEVKQRQIYRGFKRFQQKVTTPFTVESRDAIPDNLNEWEDYFWIDVDKPHLNIELTRKLKEESVKGLVDLFPKWRQNNKSFFEHQKVESDTDGQGYLRVYFEMTQRLANGDLNASFDSPIDASIVQMLVTDFEKQVGLQDRIQNIVSYFQSDYFLEVPYEFISTGLMCVLRDRVKMGQYMNATKAIDELKGIFFDHDFISTYTPYCNAMFVDSAMFEFVRAKQLNLEQKYGIKYFSKTNWAEFIQYLQSLKARKTKELGYAIELAYPFSHYGAKA